MAYDSFLSPIHMSNFIQKEEGAKQDTISFF